MSINRPSLARAACLCAVVTVWACSSLPAQLPPLNIPDSALSGALTSTHIETIRKRIQHWLQQIIDATAPGEVIKARESLVNDYLRYESVGYRYAFAREAAGQIAAALKDRLGDTDPLKSLKEVNIALAAKAMSQVSIQPALVAMVSHADPAVRYVGWQGYIGIRMRLIAQGSGARDQMFSALKTAAATEDSAAVIGQMFRVIQLPAVPPEAVSQSAFRAAQKEFYQVLQGMWMDQCKRLMNTDEPVMAESCISGVEALAGYAGAMAADRTGRTAVLQMLIDMAYASAEAYARGWARAEQTDAIVEANDALLRECEAALNTVTRQQKQYLEKPLSDAKIIARGAAVKFGKDPDTGENYGVLEWIEQLKGAGVVKPDLKPAVPLPTTAPTTTSAPATAPAPVPPPAP